MGACSHCAVECESSDSRSPLLQLNAARDYVVALAGNPNTGKSTVFNRLTGLRQHTGNWPGKTVARAEGSFKHAGRRFRLIDLPGTYSLLADSADEEIARDFVLFEQPDCVVAVCDATVLERNLFLVLQLLEITPRMVVCVNLMDEAHRKNIALEVRSLEQELGVPVVATAARRGQGVGRLIERVAVVASGRLQTRPVRTPLDPAVESAVETLVDGLRHALPSLPCPRWVALRLLDGDKHIERALLASGALQSRFGGAFRNDPDESAA